jgi:hypothetical protein
MSTILALVGPGLSGAALSPLMADALVLEG